MTEPLHVPNTTGPMTTLKNEVQSSKEETEAQRWDVHTQDGSASVR
jgi:hypothetical protein